MSSTEMSLWSVEYNRDNRSYDILRNDVLSDSIPCMKNGRRMTKSETANLAVERAALLRQAEIDTEVKVDSKDDSIACPLVLVQEDPPRRKPGRKPKQKPTVLEQPTPKPIMAVALTPPVVEQDQEWYLEPPPWFTMMLQAGFRMRKKNSHGTSTNSTATTN